MSSLNDALTRHQTYLEGLKLGTALTFTGRAKELRDGLRKIFAVLDVDTMNELTKAQVNAVIAEVRGLIDRVLGRYVADVFKFLRQIMDGERELYGAILKGEPERGAHAVYGPLASANTKAGRNRLWDLIMQRALPGNGQFIDNMFEALQLRAAGRIIDAIYKAVANGSTLKEALAALVGDKTTLFGTGAVSMIDRQNATLIDTSIQHISQMVCAAVGSTLFERYWWSSIIDSGTTPICAERNGKSYTYGDGPLPPAHYGCRAEAIPGPREPLPATYAVWLATQPADVAADLGDITNPTPLSLEAFMSKLPLILK